MELFTVQVGLGIALIIAIIILSVLYKSNNELKDHYSKLEDNFHSLKLQKEDYENRHNTMKARYDNLNKVYETLEKETTNYKEIQEDLEFKVSINRKKKSILFELLKYLNTNLAKCIAIDDIDGISKPALRISIDKENNSYIFKTFNSNNVSEILSLVTPSNQHCIRKLIIGLQDLHTEDELVTFVGVLKEHGIDLL